MKKIRLIIQVLGAVSVASFAGSMLMLYTSLVPFWEQISSNDFLNWFSNYASGIEMTTGPFVKLTTLLPLISIFLVWKIPKSRNYWLISYAFIIGIMVITFSFFIEANSSFIAKTIEPENVKEAVDTWGMLHSIRTIMGFASAIFATIGLTEYLLGTKKARKSTTNMKTIREEVKSNY